MKRIGMVLSGLVVALSVAACSFNLAVRKEDSRTYKDTSIKQATQFSVQAITKASLSIVSTSNPTDGMVIISAQSGRNLLAQNEPAKLNVTLLELEPGRVKVEAVAIQGGQLVDYGITDGMVRDFYGSLDKSMTPVLP